MPKCVESDTSRTQNLHLRDVLAIEDAEGLLQGFDLFLPAGDTILVAHTCINTRWLELLVVGQGSIELLLRAIKVRLLLLEGLLLVLLLARLVLDVLRLLRLVNRGVGHELVILLLRLSLCSACLRLEASEVR